MKHQTFRRLWPWAAIIVVGLFLRALLIGRLGTLWFDEAFSWRFARLPLGEMLDLLRYDVHPPLHAAILNLWMRIFGDGVYALRALSLVFAAAGLAAFALLARKLLDRKPAFLAVVLASLSPLMLYYGADGRMYGMIFFLSCLSSLFFIDAFKGDAGKTRVWFWVSLALVMTHVSGALVVAAQALFLLGSAERRAAFKKLLPRFFAVGIVFALWLVPAAIARMSSVGGEWQFRPSADAARPWQALLYWIWVTGNRRVLALFGIGIGLIVLAGLMRRSERRPFFRMTEESAFLLTWFAASFLPFLALAAAPPRYLIAAVPPFFLLVAKGFMDAGRGKRAVLLIGIAGILLLSFPGIAAQLMTRPYNWDKSADWIAERHRAGDRIVFGWFASRMALDAVAAKPFSRDVSQYDVRGLYPFEDDHGEDERLVRHAGTLTLTKADLEKLTPLMDGAARVFFIPNNDWALAEGGSSSEALNEWFRTNGWFLLEARDGEGRTPGVWLMVRK